MPAIGIMIGLANAGQGGAFTPQSLSGLAAWWDASDAESVTLNALDVASIADKSGNSRAASQVTAAEQPLYSLAAVNGKNVISFTGANNDSLALANSLEIIRNKPGATFVGVVKIPTLGATQRLLTVTNNSNTNLFAPQIASDGRLGLNTRRVTADTNSLLNSTAVLTAGQAAFVAASVDYATGTVFLQIDGTTRSQTAGWTVGAASENLAHGAAPLIGRQLTNTLTGDVEEYTMYERALTAAEISDLRNRYLKPKWATP